MKLNISKNYWELRIYKQYSISSLGIWFPRKRDEVLYRWPWLKGGRYVSMLASGTGECGSAGFNSLKELDKYWSDCFNFLENYEHDK